MEVEIKPFKNNRYAIWIDGKLKCNANGYGYKTKQSAHKAASYKFQGGKQKKEKNIKEAKEIYKSLNDEQKNKINKLIEDLFYEELRNCKDYNHDVDEMKKENRRAYNFYVDSVRTILNQKDLDKRIIYQLSCKINEGFEGF